MKKIRVLLADDHRMLRDGLKALLSASGDIVVVAEVSDGRAAVRVAQEVVARHLPTVDRAFFPLCEQPSPASVPA